MPRLQLTVYVNPGQLDVFINLGDDPDTFRTVGTLDTGAQQCLMPLYFLDNLEHQILRRNITIEQAGIANQSFTAVEAEVLLCLEDAAGNISEKRRVRAWFAETDEVLLGFRDLLEHAVLHIDMPLRDGWIEIA
jgi:hypothetical protein